MSKGGRVRARQTYNADTDTELSFSRGDIMDLIGGDLMKDESVSCETTGGVQGLVKSDLLQMENDLDFDSVTRTTLLKDVRKNRARPPSKSKPATGSITPATSIDELSNIGDDVQDPPPADEPEKKINVPKPVFFTELVRKQSHQSNESLQSPTAELVAEKVAPAWLSQLKSRKKERFGKTMSMVETETPVKVDDRKTPSWLAELQKKKRRSTLVIDEQDVEAAIAQDDRVEYAAPAIETPVISVAERKFSETVVNVLSLELKVEDVSKPAERKLSVTSPVVLEVKNAPLRTQEKVPDLPKTPAPKLSEVTKPTTLDVSSEYEITVPVIEVKSPQVIETENKPDEKARKISKAANLDLEKLINKSVEGITNENVTKVQDEPPRYKKRSRTLSGSSKEDINQELAQEQPSLTRSISRSTSKLANMVRGFSTERLNYTEAQSNKVISLQMSEILKSVEDMKQTILKQQKAIETLRAKIEQK